MNEDISKKIKSIKLLLRREIKIVLPVAIVLAGMITAIVIVKTAPVPQKQKPAKAVPTVQVLELKKASLPVIVKAMGTVISIRKVNLQARVSGEVIKINPEFIDGGYLKAGENILQIDDKDYRLAVEEKKAQLAKAEADMKLEMGKQAVAIREWEIMNPQGPVNKLDRELAHRKPQLNTANANVAISKAALEQAQLNLERTIIKAPFDCLILSKSADLGSQLSTQDSIAEIVATDKYWIQASIPIERLEWISVPGGKNKNDGSTVNIEYGINQQSYYRRTGTVEKLLGNLEEQGRMARILISVKDPLNLEKETNGSRQLILGEYVRVEIEGKKLTEVFSVPRSALRDNTHLWILTKNNTLEIRNVETVWRDNQTVLIRDDLNEGENLILSDIATPVNGMDLRIDPETEKAIR